MPNENLRETGSRKLVALTGSDPSDNFSQDAAKNKPPKSGIGLTEEIDETNEKVRHYDGHEPREQRQADVDAGRTGIEKEPPSAQRPL